MEGSSVEHIQTIEYYFNPDIRNATHFTLYPSGYIDLGNSGPRDRLPLSGGWNQVEDLAAYQRLFDLVKAAIRSQGTPTSKDGRTSELTITVETSEGVYRFQEDILKLRHSPFPACHPHTFETDGHAESWIAAKSSPVIDPGIRR